MTKDEYLEQVTVVITPEEGQHHPHPDDPTVLRGDSLFWLHTVGLNKLDRPELELREVPALFIEQAFAELNYWGFASLTDEIKAGQNIQSGRPVTVLLRANKSPDPFWEEREWTCLRLTTFVVLFSCAGNHEGAPVH
jgi:hypothetical protein